MSRAVKQPVGQKRLTNIAVVRYKTHGIRFEIACYKNKVFDWRSGSEQDLDEVLQTEQVFSNVSKGIMAKEKELRKVFGKSKTMEDICKEILAKGELQVSDRERALQLDSRLRDVASIIVEKCVDSNTKRPFPHALVERALKDPKIRFIPDNRKSAKQQMLEVLPKLQKHKVLEIERARMRVQLTLRTREMKEMVTRRLGEEPLSDTCQVEREKEEGAPASTSCDADNQGKSGGSAQYTYSCVMKIEPGAFRTIDSLVRGKQANAGRLEVLDLAVHNDSVVAEAEGRAGKPTKITEQMGSLSVSGDLPRGGERAVGRFKCNTCLVGFEESKLHREHFKSDWHRVNLKLRHAGEACVTEEEFMMMESAAMDSDLDHYM